MGQLVLCSLQKRYTNDSFLKQILASLLGELTALLFFGDFLDRFRIKEQKKKQFANAEIPKTDAYTESDTAERMRQMKNFDDIKHIEKMLLKGLTVEESKDSLIITAKKEIYVPEKRIVLMDQITEREAIFLKSITENKGGFIV